MFKTLFASLLFSVSLLAQPLAPYGGDLISLQTNSATGQILAGTANGKLYELRGEIWTPLTTFNYPGQNVLDILFDGDKIFVALESSNGKIVMSPDRGQTWQDFGLVGHSVRGLSRNENTLVAVARDAAYRYDGTWKQISPLNDADYDNYHSITIHPTNSNFIYAGTTHLPRRTDNAGQQWARGASKETGMIDDSDVFSIRFSKHDKMSMFVSACSGIYRSENLGKTWKKLTGIPFESRRTHSIYEHPTVPGLLFAATTAGLWRSEDVGKSWVLVSDVKMTFNAIQVDPKNSATLYAAVEDYGALRSTDTGKTWHLFNAGVSARHVSLYWKEQGIEFLGTTFDSQNGGLFRKQNSEWELVLPGVDVFTILKADRYYCGTNRGVYASADGIVWMPLGSPNASKTSPPLVPHNQILALQMIDGRLLAGGFDGLYVQTTNGWVLERIGYVNAISGDYIATSKGLYRWHGKSEQLDFAGEQATTLFAKGDRIFIGTRQGFWIGREGKWMLKGNGIPQSARVKSIWEIDGKLQVFDAVTQRIYQSMDNGESWEKIRGFSVKTGEILFHSYGLLSIRGEGLKGTNE